MIFRIIIISFFILEFFGCSALVQIGSEQGATDACRLADYKEPDTGCLDNEITSLEEDLNMDERVIYEMAKRKLSDKYQKLYFLRLGPSEKVSYLRYIYGGDTPVYYKKSFF